MENTRGDEAMTTNERRENLGPAERIIETLLAHVDHIYHGRPGVIREDGRRTTGVLWVPVKTRRGENDTRTVYQLPEKVQGHRGRRRRGPLRVTDLPLLGVMNGDNIVRNGTRVVGTYQTSGLVNPTVAWVYRQIAEVWKLDNEFAARWASYAWHQDHRDLKVVLAAFMLVQTRCGDPVIEGGEHLFDDDDYRNVGEAMALLQENGKDFNPKMLLRCWEILMLPEVEAINRELGFGRSTRRAFVGRWPVLVEKWLRYREQNPKMLEGLAKAGFAVTVRSLATRIGYKPSSPKFFELLRWNQKQADDGRRTLYLGQKAQRESWEGLSERQICNRIVKNRPNWQVLTAMVPASMGITRAIMAAAIDAGCLSDKDLIILTPTMEDLGLLQVPAVRTRWEAATKAATDMRAAHVARNVRSQAVKEQRCASLRHRWHALLLLQRLGIACQGNRVSHQPAAHSSAFAQRPLGGRR